MKFTVSMKCPDALHEAAKEAVSAEVSAITGLSAIEQVDITNDRTNDVVEKCVRWFKYEEYLTVEIDTEAGTCIVQEVK